MFYFDLGWCCRALLESISAQSTEISFAGPIPSVSKQRPITDIASQGSAGHALKTLASSHCCPTACPEHPQSPEASTLILPTHFTFTDNGEKEAGFTASSNLQQDLSKPTTDLQTSPSSSSLPSRLLSAHPDQHELQPEQHAVMAETPAPSDMMQSVSDGVSGTQAANPSSNASVDAVVETQAANESMQSPAAIRQQRMQAALHAVHAAETLVDAAILFRSRLA